MKTTVFLFLLLVLIISGCSGSNNRRSGESHPRSSQTPAVVRSSADVVQVNTADVTIPEGGNANAVVTLTIARGYHINANPATFPYLIPTEVKRVNYPDGPCVLGEKAIYPEPIRKQFAFEKEPLSVYEGNVSISLPLHVPRVREAGCYLYPGKGAHVSLPIEVAVQACDNEKCYAPANLKTTVNLNIN